MKPAAWSHSGITNFNNCPKQFYHTRVIKDVYSPPGVEADWGNYVHENFEKYLKGEMSTLPGNLEAYREYLDKLKALPGTMLVECEYAINRKMQPCKWFAQDVWCRAKLDVMHLVGPAARILDHKTGKVKHDSRQLKLSALLVFAHHPEVMQVGTGFFWLKEMRLTRDHFVRSQEAELWQEFLPDLKAYAHAFKNELFPPRPSGLCGGWCPVEKCEFWRPKRVKK